jgi:hypothetical protein
MQPLKQKRGRHSGGLEKGDCGRVFLFQRLGFSDGMIHMKRM